jgi:hypothetical protein
MDSKELRPLQSADLVAREAFKRIENFNVRPIRIPMLRMREFLYFLLWNEKTLIHLAQNGGPGNLEFLSTWDENADARNWKSFGRNSRR